MTAPIRFGGDDKKKKKRQATVDSIRQARNQLPIPPSPNVQRSSLLDRLVGPVLVPEEPKQGVTDVNPFNPFANPSAPLERRGYLTERTLPRVERPIPEPHDDIYDVIRESRMQPVRRAVAVADAAAVSLGLDQQNHESLREVAKQAAGGMLQTGGDILLSPLALSELAKKDLYSPFSAVSQAMSIPARVLGEARTRAVLDLPERLVDQLMGRPSSPTGRSARQAGQIADILLGAAPEIRRGVRFLREARGVERGVEGARALPSLEEMPPAIVSEQAEMPPFLTPDERKTLLGAVFGEPLTEPGVDALTQFYGEDLVKKMKPYFSDRQMEGFNQALDKVRRGESLSPAEHKKLDMLDDVLQRDIRKRPDKFKSIKDKVNELSDNDAVGRYEELNNKALDDPDKMTKDEWIELSHLDERLTPPESADFNEWLAEEGPLGDLSPEDIFDEQGKFRGREPAPGDIPGISGSGDIEGISPDLEDILGLPKMPAEEGMSGLDRLSEREAEDLLRESDLPEPGTIFPYENNAQLQSASEFYKVSPSTVNLKQGGDLPRNRWLTSISPEFDAALGQDVGRTSEDRARQLFDQIDRAVGEQSVIMEADATKQGITFDIPGGGETGTYAQRVTEASRPTILQAFLGGEQWQFDELLRSYGVELPRGFDLNSFRASLTPDEMGRITRDYMRLYGFQPGSQQSERFLRGMDTGLLPNVEGYDRAREALYRAVFRKPPPGRQGLP